MKKSLVRVEKALATDVSVVPTNRHRSAQAIELIP